VAEGRHGEVDALLDALGLEEAIVHAVEPLERRRVQRHHDLHEPDLVDGSGNVHVADAGNHTLRRVTPAGVVSTLAGTAGSSGSADGTGAAPSHDDPSSSLLAESLGLALATYLVQRCATSEVRVQRHRGGVEPHTVRLLDQFMTRVWTPRSRFTSWPGWSG